MCRWANCTSSYEKWHELVAHVLMTKVKNKGSSPGPVIYTRTAPFRSAYVTPLTSCVTRYRSWTMNTGLQTFTLHFCHKNLCHLLMYTCTWGIGASSSKNLCHLLMYTCRWASGKSSYDKRHERVAQVLMTKVKNEGLSPGPGRWHKFLWQKWRTKVWAPVLSSTHALLPSIVLMHSSDIMCYKVLPLGNEHTFADLCSSLLS